MEYFEENIFGDFDLTNTFIESDLNLCGYNFLQNSEQANSTEATQTKNIEVNLPCNNFEEDKQEKYFFDFQDTFSPFQQEKNSINFQDTETPLKKIIDAEEAELNSKYLAPAIQENTSHNVFVTNKPISDRKKKSDGIRKKIKVGFHKYIHQTLNSTLPKIGNKSIKLSKLSQSFISDITLSFNSKLMKKTILEIYSEHSAEGNNRIIFESIFRLGLKTPELYFFLNSTYEKLYMEYLNSSQFQIDLQKVKDKISNDEYYYKFVKLSHNYIQYFKSRLKNTKNNKDVISNM